MAEAAVATAKNRRVDVRLMTNNTSGGDQAAQAQQPPQQ